MKKILSIAIIAILIISSSACKQSPKERAVTDVAAVLNQEIAGEIKIAHYASETRFLGRAATSFRERYPNIKITFERFEQSPEAKGDDEQAEADYLKRVNTELMAGGGE